MRNILLLALLVICFSCQKETNQADEPNLIFKFKFDPTQDRLNNIGQPAAMPAGHAAQSPEFNKMSAHYIELAPTALTTLGGGAVLYRATETNTGGSNAIDFEKSNFAGDGEIYYQTPLKNINAGKYRR